MNYDPQKLKEEYQERFKNKSDEQLIDSFNGQVGNAGWGTARMFYLSTLRKELENRNIDYSDVGDKEGISYAKRVKLVGKKIVIAEK